MYTLVLWTVITTTGSAGFNARYHDWRPIAEFQTQTLCEQAAQSLNVTDRYRCLKTK